MAEHVSQFEHAWQRRLKQAKVAVAPFVLENDLELQLRLALTLPAVPRKEAPPAPVKGRRIPAEVLDVLKESKRGPDFLRLPASLPRPVYTKVDRILKKLGAAWSSTRNAHVFARDDADKIQAAIKTGVAPDDNPMDFYETPEEVATKLIESNMEGGFRADVTRLLEPSAGRGALARRYAALWREWARHMPDARLEVVLVETHEGRADTLREEAKRLKQLSPRTSATVIAGDFLAQAPTHLGSFDAIVMNPPFTAPGDARAWATHLRYALHFLKGPRSQLAAILPRFNFKDDPLAFEIAARAFSREQFGKEAFAESGAAIRTWGLVVEQEDLVRLPETDAVEIIARNEYKWYQELDRAARREVPDPELWRHLVQRVTIDAIETQTSVRASLTTRYQRALSSKLFRQLTED